MLKIISVDKKSIAGKLKIKAGSSVVSINGNEICDILDYQFYEGMENLTLAVSHDGAESVFDIEKYGYEPLGLEVSEPEMAVCRNKCLFCFVDQLPGGLRETLYIKDDDWRYSFICGNYVTMTNVSDEEISRIIKYRISPLYISVHATDEATRALLLGVKADTARILPLLNKLHAAGIELHTQIVVCRGINDGQALIDSLRALIGLAQSISVVPVGLTKFGNSDYAISCRDAQLLIDTCESSAQQSYDKYGSRKVYAADELFLKAGIDIPGAQYYEDYPQLENGVGLIRKFEDEFLEELEYIEKATFGNIHIVTSVSARSMMERLCEIFFTKTGKTINVHTIVNNFFGDTVTVAGLIAGKDIIEQLKSKKISGKLLIPASMLRMDTDQFLDDTKVADIEHALNVRVVAVPVDGAAFAKVLTEDK